MHRTRGFLTLLPLHGRGQPGRLVRACDTTQGNGCLLARDEDRMPLEVGSRACGPLVHGVPHKSPCSVAQRRLVCLRHGEASGHDVLPLATLHAPWRVTSYRPPPADPPADIQRPPPRVYGLLREPSNGSRDSPALERLPPRGGSGRASACLLVANSVRYLLASHMGGALQGAAARGTRAVPVVCHTLRRGAWL